MSTLIVKLADGEELVVEDPRVSAGDGRELALDRRREALDEREQG